MNPVLEVRCWKNLIPNPDPANNLLIDLEQVFFFF